MIYQPRSIQPIWKSIDASDDARISMVVNTNNYVESYKLTIFDMDNDVIYQGSKEDFPNYVYNGQTCFIDIPTSYLTNGNDYKWVARLYQSTADMLITYGNIINPTTYIYSSSYGLSLGKYCIEIDGYAYVFDLIKNLGDYDSLIFDTSDQTITLRMLDSNSEFYLPTTKITLGNFATLNTTASGDSYVYTVGSDGLSAGDYCFEINGTSYWFTTLSDLDSGDSIAYDTVNNKITQTHVQSAGNIVLSLMFVSGEPLTFVKSENTNASVYIKKNINIKEDMIFKIGNDEATIVSYDVATGLATLDSSLTSIPEEGDSYYIYSDFVETAPENILYARANPTLSISGVGDVLTSKSADFTGQYSQSEGVPLVYFIWNLYSTDGENLSLIKTSGKTYNANITFSYDGFKNAETYVLSLTCENEFGILVSDRVTFNVNYEEIIYDEQPTAEQTNQQGIKVSWMTTIPTEPYSEYIKNAFGYIQSSNNTRNSIWLETGQRISPGNKIIVGSTEAEGVIGNYDINTGFTTLSTSLNYTPVNGDYYHILSEPDYNLAGVNFLYNTPYNGVNSAQLKGYHLVYEKENGMAPWPDDYQLTLQFLLNKDFFYGDADVYQDMAIIAEYEGSESDGSESIIFFAKNYSFYAITPSMSNGSLIEAEIESVEEDGSAIYVDALDIDLTKQKYLKIEELDYIACIEDYDSENNKIVLEKALPSTTRPTVGSKIMIYDTVEQAYYNSVNNVFCLQNNNIKNYYYDYIWSDSEYWNDSYYWVEGGTQIERAADTWWKVKITPEELIVGRGGV